MMSVDCVECAAAQFHCVNASAHSDATERARRAVGGLSARAASDRLALQAGHASHGEWRCRCASNCCSSDLWTQILIRCTVFSEYSIFSRSSHLSGCYIQSALFYALPVQTAVAKRRTG